MSKRRCTATTSQGRPCRAWARRDSEPPLCGAHIHQDRDTPSPSFYGLTFRAAEQHDLAAYATPDSLADEIAGNRVLVRRLFEHLNGLGTLTTGELATIAPLIFKGSRIIGELLMKEQTLQETTGADMHKAAIDQALTELSEEWGVDL